jgi:hypothetical protein
MYPTDGIPPLGMLCGVFSLGVGVEYICRATALQIVCQVTEDASRKLKNCSDFMLSFCILRPLPDSNETL